MPTFLVLLLLLLGTGCATQSNSKLQTLLEQFEAQGFSGTVLVAKDDRIILHEGYGFADQERRIPNDRETLYEIGSLNKTFTAAAILQLEAQGKLRTTDRISKYLGDFPPPKDTATIHHLATHSAGLVVDGADTGDGTNRDDFIATVKRLPAESVPGERERYTNAGYSVLTAIIEKVAGVSYDSYVRQNLFRDVWFRGETLPRPMARGYNEKGVIEPPPLRWGTHGAGGMIMTVADLYRWFTQLRRDPVMKPMFEDRPEEEGYAWHVEVDKNGRRRILKGGGMPQYQTQLIWYPDERVVIIWATNDLTKRRRQELNERIANTVLD